MSSELGVEEEEEGVIAEQGKCFESLEWTHLIDLKKKEGYLAVLQGKRLHFGVGFCLRENKEEEEKATAATLKERAVEDSKEEKAELLKRVKAL